MIDSCVLRVEKRESGAAEGGALLLARASGVAPHDGAGSMLLLAGEKATLRVS